MSWTLIEHQALTSSAASVTLGSGGTIPQTYKTLKLVVSARTDATVGGSGDAFTIRPNGSTTSLTSRAVFGTGAVAYSNSRTDILTTATPSDYTASTFSNCEITFSNYASATNKVTSADAVNENNATAATTFLVAGLWSNTAAITSIQLVPLGGNFVSGCTFTLYGLA